MLLMSLLHLKNCTFPNVECTFARRLIIEMKEFYSVVTRVNAPIHRIFRNIRGDIVYKRDFTIRIIFSFIRTIVY